MNETAQVGRLAPVRLTEIPLNVRRRYGARLLDRAREDGNLLLAVELAAAIERPTRTVYHVPAAALDRVLGPHYR